MFCASLRLQCCKYILTVRASWPELRSCLELALHLCVREKSVSHLFLLYILLTLPAVVGIRPLDSFDGRFECVTF